VKWICRSLAGTKENGITFTPDLQLGLDCYVEADHARLFGHETTKILFLSDPKQALSWRSSVAQ